MSAEPLWHKLLFFGCLSLGAAFLLFAAWWLGSLFIAIGRMMGGGR